MAEVNLNILEVLFSRDWGSTETNACRFSRDFIRLGHKVHMVTLPNSLVEAWCKQYDVPYTAMRPFSKFIDPVNALKIASLARMHRCDVLHVHRVSDVATVGLAKKMLKNCSMVLTQHTTGRYPVKSFICRRLYRRIDMIVAAAELIRKNLLNANAVKHGQIISILNGIDTEALMPQKKGEFRDRFEIPRRSVVVGLFGIFNRPNSQQHLIRAASAVLDKFDNAYVLVAGKDPENRSESENLAELRRTISGQNREDRFRFTGYIGEIEELLPVFNLVVFQSSGNSSGMTILKSMAMGIPVVAAHSGMSRDIIDEGINGVFFEPDSPDDLQEKVIGLLTDRVFLARIGRRARKKVCDEYNIQKKLIEYERLFFNLKTPVFAR
ncbi:glycosyltransferase family 4 protein [candidate division KSB1 bacterium]